MLMHLRCWDEMLKKLWGSILTFTWNLLHYIGQVDDAHHVVLQ